MPSKEVDDPNFKRLYYIRYADDWLVGVSGSKQEAVFHDLKRTMEMSLSHTLANKHKSTTSKVFAKFKATREVDGHPYKVLQVEVPREGRQPLVAYFGGFKLGVKKNAEIVDAPIIGQIYNVKSQFV